MYLLPVDLVVPVGERIVWSRRTISRCSSPLGKDGSAIGNESVVKRQGLLFPQNALWKLAVARDKCRISEAERWPDVAARARIKNTLSEVELSTGNVYFTWNTSDFPARQVEKAVTCAGNGCQSIHGRVDC